MDEREASAAAAKAKAEEEVRSTAAAAAAAAEMTAAAADASEPSPSVGDSSENCHSRSGSAGPSPSRPAPGHMQQGKSLSPLSPRRMVVKPAPVSPVHAPLSPAPARGFGEVPISTGRVGSPLCSPTHTLSSRGSTPGSLGLSASGSGSALAAAAAAPTLSPAAEAALVALPLPQLHPHSTSPSSTSSSPAGAPAPPLQQQLDAEGLQPGGALPSLRSLPRSPRSPPRSPPRAESMAKRAERVTDAVLTTLVAELAASPPGTASPPAAAAHAALPASGNEAVVEHLTQQLLDRLVGEAVEGMSGAWGLAPELPPPQLGHETRPEVALVYLRELLQGGLVLVHTAAGEVPQVPLQSYLTLEQSFEAHLADLGLPTDEGLQILHKLLLDLFNAALREEAARAAAPAMAFRGHGYAAGRPARGGHREEAIAAAALQRTLEWLELGQQGEGMPIEVRLSCLLSSDAAEVERGTGSLAEEKDRLVAEVADSIMLAELRDLSSLVSRL